MDHGEIREQLNSIILQVERNVTPGDQHVLDAIATLHELYDNLDVATDKEIEQLTFYMRLAEKAVA